MVNMFRKAKYMGTSFLATLTLMIMAVSGASAMTFTDPAVPDSTPIFQEMINAFGTAGTIGLAIIGGAVALGIMVVLGMWGWRTAKKWLSSAK